jgi:hypothetical protein
MVLYRCKVCGREHRYSTEFRNKEYFESGSIRTRTIECMDTGRSASYLKRDMRWKDGD